MASDVDSRNTDRRMLDFELNEDYTKSLDAEIEQLKKTWQEGTIMEQYFCIDNMSKSGQDSKYHSRTNTRRSNPGIHINLPSGRSNYDSNQRLVKQQSNNESYSCSYNHEHENYDS